jgi:transposase
VRAPCSYDHLNVISAITPSGRLFMQIYDDPIHGEQVVAFVRHLLGHIAGKLLIIWDGASIHRGQAIKDFLAAGGSQRVHLERLPGYAPDLNPDEGIWGYLKSRELGNVVCRNRTQLRYELRLATARLRHKPHVIQGCITQAGLSL